MARNKLELDPDAPYGLEERPDTADRLADPDLNPLTRGSLWRRTYWTEAAHACGSMCS